MLLSWSEQVHESFEKASPPLALPGSDFGLASLGALQGQGSLVLDSSGDDETKVRDLIMGFLINLSKAALQAPKGSKMYGYEYMDIVMESPESELKKTKLLREGLGWISLLNETKCLFCAHLGDAIVGKRSPLPLSPCNSLIEGYYLMAASIQSIDTLSKSHFWHLAGAPFQQCEHDNQGSCWSRLEAFEEILQEMNDRQASELSNASLAKGSVNGALVFGKQTRSKTFFPSVFNRPRLTPSRFRS
ncbi:unnamed protein product [Penicillium bialowiezense]